MCGKECGTGLPQSCGRVISFPGPSGQGCLFTNQQSHSLAQRPRSAGPEFALSLFSLFEQFPGAVTTILGHSGVGPPGHCPGPLVLGLCRARSASPQQCQAHRNVPTICSLSHEPRSLQQGPHGSWNRRQHLYRRLCRPQQHHLTRMQHQLALHSVIPRISRLAAAVGATAHSLSSSWLVRGVGLLSHSGAAPSC